MSAESERDATVESLVTRAPETLPASIVALDPQARKALLTESHWHALRAGRYPSTAELVVEAAARLESTRNDTDSAAADEQIAADTVAALRANQ